MSVTILIKMSSDNWCFTLNNYKEDDFDNILKNPNFKYVVVGREVGESGTPHLQGFLIYKNKCRFSAIKKILPQAHIEAARGDAYTAAKYCMKDENYKEAGERPAARAVKRKTEFTNVVDLAKKGKYSELLQEYPGMYLRYYKTLRNIGDLYDEPTQDLDKLDNYWYWGASGSGKSRTARQNFPGSYIKMANKWWNGYRGQPTVIIDDVSPNHYALIDDLKIWTDHYVCPVETKGGMINIRPKTIVVTSQYTPAEVFKSSEDCSAICRRFKVVKF